MIINFLKNLNFSSSCKGVRAAPLVEYSRDFKRRGDH